MSPADAQTLRAGLDSVSQADVRGVAYDGTYEDLFFYVDRLIVQACGEDVGGRLHTARSRNDIDMTMYRMRQREFILGLMAASFELRRLAARSRGPSSRDGVRRPHAHAARAADDRGALSAGRDRAVGAGRRAAEKRLRADEPCPLGACAITGTGFPIDRQLTADLLGFTAPTGNTTAASRRSTICSKAWRRPACFWWDLGALSRISCCGRPPSSTICGSATASSSAAASCRRSAIRWLSSMSAPSSKALGQSQAIVTSVHNTPFGDIVDTGDDLQPLVFSMFLDATRAVNLMAAAMRTADFDAERLEARAADGWTTLTELADVLVRDHGIPFRTAHQIVARLVPAQQRRCRAGTTPGTARVEGASPARRAPRRGVCRGAGTAAEIFGDGAGRDSEPDAFCPRPEDAGRARARRNRGAVLLSLAELEADRSWSTNTTRALSDSERRLNERVSGL